MSRNSLILTLVIAAAPVVQNQVTQKYEGSTITVTSAERAASWTPQPFRTVEAKPGNVFFVLHLTIAGAGEKVSLSHFTVTDSAGKSYDSNTEYLAPLSKDGKPFNTEAELWFEVPSSAKLKTFSIGKTTTFDIEKIARTAALRRPS